MAPYQQVDELQLNETGHQRKTVDFVEEDFTFTHLTESYSYVSCLNKIRERNFCTKKCFDSVHDSV